MRLFRNRDEAAHDLSEKLQFLKDDKPIVLGLANGGVPLAIIIARALDTDMDALMLERLYAPGQPQTADSVVGAVDEHGRISMIHSLARWHHLTSQQMVGPAREAFRELEATRSMVRELLPELDVRDRTVIIVDEGIGSGARMLGAIQSVRDRGARKVIVAAPAGTSRATWQLHETADKVVIPHAPSRYRGVEHFYAEYTPVSNAVMIAMLQRWNESRPRQQTGVRTITTQFKNNRGMRLITEMDLPLGIENDEGPYAAVIFIHGHESDSRSTRSVPISRRLAKRDIIGVRVDLIGHGRSEGTIEDATDEQVVSDVRMIYEQLRHMREVDSHRIGLVASGAMAAPAIELAASCDCIKALVLRGPTAGSESPLVEQIRCPTLLIHAENDTALDEIIEDLEEHLTCKNRLLRISDANRLFNDPISRELMINASVEWLANYLAADIAPSEDQPVVETLYSNQPTPSPTSSIPNDRNEGN